ncbi:MAG TPA: PEGA domain-containing protein, partial [Casimicrobiaceae bacterium]|nr:PEGA domain-containing protein [Casimicrobiaceae bacterium]
MGLRVVVAIVLLLGGVAHADDKPWAEGVSQAQQDAALAKFKEGNDSFVKDEWRKALDLYLEALKSWDHPNIRYNAAICLIKLDRMVEAYEHMQAAMRYGAAPLGPDLHKQGETYLQVLKSSTAYIEVVCKQPEGVTVTLDNKRLDKCPDTLLVTPGKHQIVSEKQGYRTERKEVMAPPGGKETVIITMQVEGTRKLTRRWSRWIPYTVVGVGTALSLAAVPLFITARDGFDQYETDVANVCSPEGCAPNDPRLQSLDDDLSSAKTYRALTISSIALGATGIGVGIALIVMNQPRYATITPMTGSDRTGLVLTTAW